MPLSSSKRCFLTTLMLSLLCVMINFLSLIWWLQSSTEIQTETLNSLVFYYKNSSLPLSLSCTQLLDRGVQLAEKWIEVWKFGQDYGTNKTLPNYGIVDGDSFVELIRERMVPVREVLKSCGDKILFRLEKSQRDLNIFMTVTGSEERYRNLETTLAYFHHSLEENPYNLTIKIIVVEIAQIPSARIADNMNLDYIFFPKSLVNVTGTPDNFFPKSFAYNIGFVLTEEASWNVFHDVDIIVPSPFFSVFHTASKQRSWFLPYTLVDYLSNFETEYFYMRDIKKGNFPWFHEAKTKNTERFDYSIGGCVFISSELFKKIGGYDQEVNFGWAPEDWWLIEKLKFYEPIYRAPLTLKHLFHKSRRSGQYADFSHLLLGHFANLSCPDKEKYFDLKKKILL